MTSPVVRAAVEADAPALLALRRSLADETKYMLLEPQELTDTVEDERARIRRLSASANAALFVAEHQGSLVGMLRAAGIEARRTRHNTSIAVGVLRAHWGRGIASELITRMLAWSRESGRRRVELTVHTENLRAVALYTRLGFSIEGLRRQSLLVDGSYVDEYYMALIHSGLDERLRSSVSPKHDSE